MRVTAKQTRRNRTPCPIVRAIQKQVPETKTDSHPKTPKLCSGMFENSFLPSAHPTLRYICPEFGQRSPLRLPHPGQISHKLGRTDVRKQFPNTPQGAFEACQRLFLPAKRAAKQETRKMHRQTETCETAENIGGLFSDGKKQETQQK